MVKLQDLDNLMKNIGKTVEFYGFSSTSEDPNKTLIFDRDEYSLVQIEIPHF